jgi:hypothetical protein
MSKLEGEVVVGLVVPVVTVVVPVVVPVVTVVVPVVVSVVVVSGPRRERTMATESRHAVCAAKWSEVFPW